MSALGYDDVAWLDGNACGRQPASASIGACVPSKAFAEVVSTGGYAMDLR
jgi:hypothetical protein